jgi:hypothetical protein
MSKAVEFPRPFENATGRLFFLKRDLENYVRALAGLEPVESNDITLIPAMEAAKILGVCRRTLSRRLAESQAQKAA